MPRTSRGDLAAHMLEYRLQGVAAIHRVNIKSPSTIAGRLVNNVQPSGGIRGRLGTLGAYSQGAWNSLSQIAAPRQREPEYIPVQVCPGSATSPPAFWCPRGQRLTRHSRRAQAPLLWLASH